MGGKEGSNLLVHAHYHTLASLPYIFFLSDFYVISFLSYLLLLFLLFFVLSLVLASPFTVQSQGLFILLVVMGFTVLPLNYFCPGVGVLPHHPLVCQLPSYHHFPVAVPRSVPRQKSFVLLSYSPWHSHLDKGWVFFLANSYGMHLVTPTHLSLF